jgi:NADPH:quinone reductase-like Zn-dependent oxidoreductase
MKAVRFEQYGGPEVLEVWEVDRPSAGPGEILVEVRAASINPGEIAIREGQMAKQWPSTFPSGQGSDFAGVIAQLGEGVESFAIDDEVIGWTDDRASHAEFVVVPVDHLTAKPLTLSWEVAGSLFVAPMAAVVSVQVVDPQQGETIVVSAAAGGVGLVAAQLARNTGAKVVGLAGEKNHEWLRSVGVEPVAYGEGQEERIRALAPDGVDGFIDTFGGGYTDLGIALGVSPARVTTVIDFQAAERLGIQALTGSSVVSADMIAEIANLIARGGLKIPIAHTYALSEVREAYEQLAERHTNGKIVLIP